MEGDMMADGMFLYSKGNMCGEDLWEARHLIIDNLEDSEELNDMFVTFVCSRESIGEPTDNILERFADSVIAMMKNDGYEFETHGGNVWQYVVKCDCEHCEHKGEGMEFGFPKCNIHSYSGDYKGVKYCVHMAEVNRK